MKKLIGFFVLTSVLSTAALAKSNQNAMEIDENYTCDSYKIAAIKKNDRAEIEKFLSEYSKAYNLNVSSAKQLLSMAEKYQLSNPSGLISALLENKIDFGTDRHVIRKLATDVIYSNNRLDGYSECNKALGNLINSKK